MRPPPLVPRSQRWEVAERILFDGREALPLDEDQAPAAGASRRAEEKENG